MRIDAELELSPPCPPCAAGEIASTYKKRRQKSKVVTTVTVDALQKSEITNNAKYAHVNVMQGVCGVTAACHGYCY